MTATEFFAAMAQLSGLLFVVTSMLAGLIVLATAVGARFLPKLVQSAGGDVAFGVGLMVLLMVVTIFYIPIVLPLLLPVVLINSWDIAQSLIVLLLILPAIGLLVISHSPDEATKWQPAPNKSLGLAILVLLAVGLGLNVANILNLLGTGGIPALLLFIMGAPVTGLNLGDREANVRSVMGLGTVQRNVSAAIIVARRISSARMRSYWSWWRPSCCWRQSDWARVR